MTADPITDDELEVIREVLDRVPRGFRHRLVRVLGQALEDEDDGAIEIRADLTGRGHARGFREWRAHFSATGRPPRPREAA